MEERGHERRWYQKPEFIFTIIVFLLAQGTTYWRSSVNQATAETNQRRDFEEFRRSSDEFKKDLLGRMSKFESKQEEVLRAWNAEHDDVNTLTGMVAAQRKEFDDFVSRYREEKMLQDTFINNARERVIKLEAKQQP